MVTQTDGFIYTFLVKCIRIFGVDEMKFLNGTGVIDEVTTKNGTNGLFYKLKIDGRTFNAFDSEDAFEQLKVGDFPAGTAVSYQYTQTTKGEYTYKNLAKLSKVEGAQAKEVVQKAVEKTEVRNKTGDQIVRMNALTNAIGFLDLNKEVVAMNLKKGDSLDAAISEEMVTRLAEVFEKWVKRNQ